MSHLARRLGMLTAGLAIAFVAACSGMDSATGPSNDTAIPTLDGRGGPQATQAACAVWSCQINQCQADPALYGACCIQAAGGEYTVQPKPSCEGPPPPHNGQPSWCGEANAVSACIEKKVEDTSFNDDCFSQPYFDGLTANMDVPGVFSECNSN